MSTNVKSLDNGSSRQKAQEAIANHNDQFMALMAGDITGEEDDLPLVDQSVALSNGARQNDWAVIQARHRPIEWDWQSYIPRSFLVLGVGESGVGKSIVILVGICKSYILGTPWPDGTPYTGTTGKVLWIETESAMGLNLSRAEAFGLPLDQFISIELEDEAFSLSLDDNIHRQIILEAAMREDVRLIVIDSLSGSHQRDENSAEMLGITKWLAFLAQHTGKPVIATHHLNKGFVLPSQGITLRHVRGSTAIVQLARVVWALDMPNPMDKTVKRLSIIKNNLVEFPDPLVFTIEEGGIVHRSLPKAPSRRDRTQELSEFLYELVVDGDVPSTEMQQAVEEAGFSYDAAKRIKESIGIETVKKAGGWYWRLPQED